MRRQMSRQRSVVARMVRRAVMLRMRWRRMVRVLHRSGMAMIVRWGIAEAGGAREGRGGGLQLPRRIALFARSSVIVVVVDAGGCRDVRGINGPVISRNGGIGG